MASMTKKMQNRGRLFELLEEQQEPFLLDVYLSEHGYSGKALKSQAALCWIESACRRLRRLSNYGFKRRRGGGILRCVLNKFACNKVIKKALNWEISTALVSGRWSNFCSFFEMGGKTQVAESHPTLHSAATDEDESDIDVEGTTIDAENAKKLSPISVLQLHFDEVDEEMSTTLLLISPREAGQATWNSSEEFLYCTTSPVHQNSHTKRHFEMRHHLLLDCLRQVEGKVWNSHEGASPKKKTGAIIEEILSWDKQRGDLANICQLIDYDLQSTSRQGWNHFQPEIREIGVEIETIIFEEIREETALDFLGF